MEMFVTLSLIVLSVQLLLQLCDQLLFYFHFCIKTMKIFCLCLIEYGIECFYFVSHSYSPFIKYSKKATITDNEIPLLLYH